MLNDDQRMQMMYTGVSMDFNTERTLGWSRSQMLTIINGTALPLLLAPVVTTELRYLVVAFGLLTALFWYLANRRTQRRITYWQDCLSRMEPPETQLVVFRVFTGSDWKGIGRPPFLYALNVLPIAFIAIWALVLFLVVIF